MTAARPATRYARALFDVALKEGRDLETGAGASCSGFAALVAGHETLAQRARRTRRSRPSKKRAVVEALLARGGQLTPSLGEAARCCSPSAIG